MGEFVDFVVIDVETANHDLSSICQVGIASFHNGSLQNSWVSLVDPQDEFDPVCVSIHGIDSAKVGSSPNWATVYPEVRSLLQGQIVASHTAFDRVALLRACEKYGLENCECRWLDSAMVVRRAWPIFSRSGYGLTNVATKFGIEYQPHDALEDARCAGEILLRAIAETGLDIDQWLERVKHPIQSSVGQHAEPLLNRPPKERATRPIQPVTPHPIARHGDPEGPLYGEVLVFTGALAMPRHEAADAAAAAGCEVATNVTKQTTLLVVGNQDVRKLAGKERSSKHRKAEELIDKGQKIRIVSESDFQRIAEQRIVTVGERS